MEVIYTKNGSVDWLANGWPEPNSAGITEDDDGNSVDTMPDDIFDIWLDECNDLDELGVE